MKRFFSILILSMAMLPLTGHARTIVDLFATEPGDLFPLLTRTSRLDMVDYYKSGQVVAMRNNLTGESRLLEMDSAYLKVQTSGSRVVEMLMRKAGKDTVITVIETVMTPVPDSRLTQWNVHWQRFTSEKLFKMPVIDDFVIGRMPEQLRADLEAAVIFPLVELTFGGDDHQTVQARHGIERFLVPEEYKRFSDYLKPSLEYRFDGLKIKPARK